MTYCVLITEEYQWRKISRDSIDIFYKGKFDDVCIDTLFSLPFKDNDFVTKHINSIDVNFSVVISTQNFCIIAVDKIRSTPIVYTKSHDKWYVDCKISRLINTVGEREIDKYSALSIAMSGYTIGDNTVYKSIKSLIAGQLVILRGPCEIKKIQYYQYLPKSIDCGNISHIEIELKQVTLNILKKTIESLNGRQAVIPLSAGNDSRLIASGFRHLGYENVKCYSYGFEDFESNTSKIIAQKLGYDWKLIRLSIRKEKKFYQSEEFKKYLDFSDVATAIPVVRWLSTVRILKESGWINNDAIFINGNSGDFISGGHINSTLFNRYSESTLEKKNNIEHALQLFLKKHFRLWGRLQNKENSIIISSNLLHECNKLLEYDNNVSIESLYESLEYSHRQTKYVVSAQRVYEYYGYEWRLPLWDVDYLEFWKKVPVNLKYRQKLYKDMLITENWADVWKIPINKTNIRPIWIAPLRRAAQFIFLIFGNRKSQWRKFEIAAFEYWMDNGRVTTLFPYSNFLFNSDIKGVQSLISKKYLNDKKYHF
jgi:asparagine synthase (glutamine-hydrolysing)